MIGTKIQKESYDSKAYENEATWCNENNACIVDKGDYWETEAIVADTNHTEPTVEERLTAVEDYINAQLS